MREQAQQKLDDIATQVAIHKPFTLIPFASYVWYCRLDNFHLNAGANRIRYVYYRFRNDGCVVLYPDDILEVGGQHDSSQALAAYAVDEAKHAAPLYLKERRYTPEELDALSELLQRDMCSKNWMWLLHGYLKPVRIYLTDIDRSLTYSMLSGIVWTDASAADADICFVSAAMAQMLTHGSGYDTLYISGRFVERRPGSRFHLSRNFFVSQQNEHDRFFPSSFLNFAYIRSRFGG